MQGGVAATKQGGERTHPATFRLQIRAVVYELGKIAQLYHHYDNDVSKANRKKD